MKHQQQPISSWAEEDKPREKLLQRGIKAMTDAELIAILLRSGSRELSAVELAQKLLKQSDNKISNLAKLSAQDLMKMKGIGEAKALSLIAAIEIGRRRSSENIENLEIIKSSNQAFQILQALIGDADYEEFWILILNSRNIVTRKELISDGGMSQTLVDSKKVFKKAIEYKAHAIILAHNHPSGNLKPSQADIDLTKKLVSAGKTLDIQVLDHIIVTSDSYYSFGDEGMIS